MTVSQPSGAVKGLSVEVQAVIAAGRPTPAILLGSASLCLGARSNSAAAATGAHRRALCLQNHSKCLSCGHSCCVTSKAQCDEKHSSTSW